MTGHSHPAGGPAPEPPLRSRQLDFARPIPGTYLVTGMPATRAYRFSKFCMSLRHAEQRERVRADLEAAMREAGLSEAERQLVREHDWNGMLRHGTSTFLVLKLAAALGVSQNRMGADMRGESYEQFMASRNVKGAS